MQFNSEDYILATEYKNTATTSQISPRIGFSFPVTDRTVFHAQYGKFIQQSRLNDSYRGAAQMSGNIKRRVLGYRANGWGLKPERTTQYELGFAQQVSEYASFDITAFYKDIQDQIQFIMVPPTGGPRAQIYSSLANQRLLDLQGDRDQVHPPPAPAITAQVNYTFWIPVRRPRIRRRATASGSWASARTRFRGTSSRPTSIRRTAARSCSTTGSARTTAVRSCRSSALNFLLHVQQRACLHAR